MRRLEQPGGSVFVTRGPDWRGGDERVYYAILDSAIQRRADRRQSWQIGQLYGLVNRKLMKTRYIFRGLKRRMLVRGNGDADQEKMAFSWRSSSDYQFVGGRFSDTGTILEVSAEEGTVFVVIVSPNKMNKEFPDIAGWIEHWSWIDEDPDQPEKPVDHATRYDGCIWERND